MKYAVGAGETTIYGHAQVGALCILILISVTEDIAYQMDAAQALFQFIQVNVHFYVKD